MLEEIFAKLTDVDKAKLINWLIQDLKSRGTFLIDIDSRTETTDYYIDSITYNKAEDEIFFEIKEVLR